MWGGPEIPVAPGFRVRPVVVATVVLAALSVGGMWLPWFSSGASDRNSFGFFRAAQLLGIEWVTPFRIAWFLLPVLLPLALLLLLLGAHRSGLAVLVLLGSVLAVTGALSLLAFGLANGSAAAAVAGGCTTVLGIAGVRPGRAGRDPIGR